MEKDQKTTKAKKRRPYETDPLVKIKNGEPWKVTVYLDNDNARNVVKNTKTTGGKKLFYQGEINKRLREAYDIKK